MLIHEKFCYPHGKKRKQEEINHPLLEESMPTGVIYTEQARLLAKHIRGEIEYYPAFLWR